MKELVEILAKALVNHPEEVKVSEVNKEDTLVLQLTVNKEDMGKVIGKQGKVAKAIRSVVRAAAIKKGKKVVVEII